jgi:hypothetical protein
MNIHVSMTIRTEWSRVLLHLVQDRIFFYLDRELFFNILASFVHSKLAKHEGEKQLMRDTTCSAENVHSEWKGYRNKRTYKL